MKIWILIAVIVLLIAGGIYYYSGQGYVSSGNSKGEQQNVTGADINIDLRNFAFSPAEITINVGDRVRWTNYDSVMHTVTSDNGLFMSGDLRTGGTYNFIFNEPGTYAYHCSIHPTMTGMIVVK